MEDRQKLQRQLADSVAARAKESRGKRLEVAQNYLDGDFLQMVDPSKTIDRLNQIGQPQQADRLAQLVPKLTKPKSVPETGFESFTIDEADPIAEEGNQIVLEALVGRNDLLSVQFLHEGSQRARGVGRIVTLPLHGPNGTGFMISPQLLMTNHHVLMSKSDALRNVVQFDYGDSRDGSSVIFKFRPDRFFLTSEIGEFDCTVVAVEPQSDSGKPLRDFGWLPLTSEENAVQEGERVNIIHHPRGELKQVSIRDNFVAGSTPEASPKYWLYASDTRRGSSGAPVFNEEWDVVALHHAAVEIDDPAEVNVYRKILQSHGMVGLDHEGETIQLNEGIRIRRIRDWLADEASRFNPQESALYEEVLNSEPPIESESNPISPPVTMKPTPHQDETAENEVYSVPMTFNFYLGPRRTSGASPDAAATPPRPAASDTDQIETLRTLELFKNRAESQESIFKALSYLQTQREGKYLPESPALEQTKSDYYGNLVQQVSGGQIDPDDLYEELHTLSSGKLSIVDRFPESMRQMDDLVAAERPAGLESMVILESGAAYSRARAHLYTWVDLQPHRMLKCPYTDAIIAPEQIMLRDLINDIGQGDLLPQRFKNNRYLNCEHIVPQSWFKEDYPDGVSDLHHLIAADGGANNYRSNCPYRILGGAGELGPANNPDYIPKAGHREDGFFEPAKGKHVVARATLYFIITYKGALDASNYGAAEIDMLKDWARARAPDEYEIHRNHAAFEVQGNRNPLIDFPEWIDKIDFRPGIA